MCCHLLVLIAPAHYSDDSLAKARNSWVLNPAEVFHLPPLPFDIVRRI